MAAVAKMRVFERVRTVSVVSYQCLPLSSPTFCEVEDVLGGTNDSLVMCFCKKEHFEGITSDVALSWQGFWGFWEGD